MITKELEVTDIVEQALAAKQTLVWSEEKRSGVNAKVYFDCCFKEVTVRSRVADVVSSGGMTYRIRWNYSGVSHRLFRATKHILVDQEVAQRYLEYHWARGSMSATAYHEQIRSRYQQTSSQEFMSKPVWHRVAAGYFDSLYLFGDFYIALLDDCKLCRPGEWLIMVCDGTLRLQFSKARCNVTDICEPSTEIIRTSVGSRHCRCLQKSPVDPDPFARNNLNAETLLQVGKLGGILFRLDFDVLCQVQNSGLVLEPFEIDGCDPLKDFVHLLRTESGAVSPDNIPLLRWGGALLMFLGTEDAVSQTVGVRLAEPSGPLREVIKAVTTPTGRPPRNFVDQYGVVEIDNEDAVSRLRHALETQRRAFLEVVGWGKLVVLPLLENVLQRYGRQPMTRLREVATVVKFLHYTCLCALRSSPATYNPDLLSTHPPTFTVPPSTDDAKQLNICHRNDADSRERQQYQSVGGCFPFSQIRPRPTYPRDSVLL